jgi:hypothetical protein
MGEAVGLNLAERKVKKVRQNKMVDLVCEFGSNTQKEAENSEEAFGQTYCNVSNADTLLVGDTAVVLPHRRKWKR